MDNICRNCNNRFFGCEGEDDERTICDSFVDVKDEICYECTGYGDDYYIDKDGNLVCACGDCWINKEDDAE